MSAVITSVTGVQNLTNLQTFDADWNGLQTVDLSGMTSLTYVDVSDCKLNGVGANSLTSINVTGCTNITELRLDDSDFSANGLSSIVGLSDLTNLTNIDMDQSGLSGTLDLSGFPSLIFLDVFGNQNVTEVIITGSQPIEIFYADDCSFTQVAIDNVLTELSQNGIINGTIQMTGASMSLASEAALPAIRTLSNNGWSMDLNDYSVYFEATNAYPSQSQVCTDIGTSTFGYGLRIYSGSIVQSGSSVYVDAKLITAQADGWFGISGSNEAYLVSGSGLIVSQSTCP